MGTSQHADIVNSLRINDDVGDTCRRKHYDNVGENVPPIIHRQTQQCAYLCLFGYWGINGGKKYIKICCKLTFPIKLVLVGKDCTEVVL